MDVILLNKNPPLLGDFFCSSDRIKKVIVEKCICLLYNFNCIIHADCEREPLNKAKESINKL